MHDISDNRYMAVRGNMFDGYSLSDFLHNEFAVERRTDINELMLAVYGSMMLNGFNMHLAGFYYLASLTARYIIKSDYNENTAITAIAEAKGTTEDYIRTCIKSCIELNVSFKATAGKALDISINDGTKLSLTDTVEILGAIFKIYYNYTVETEIMKEDKNPFVNFNRITIENGSTR